MTTPTKIAVGKVGSPDPRYARVITAYAELSLVEIGMIDKYGDVIATSDGACYDPLAHNPPELDYSIDNTMHTLTFPLFIGWQIIMCKYEAYTLTILFGKNLKDV